MQESHQTIRESGSGLRLFLSHTSEHKENVAILKEALSPFDIVSFVAHEDITPILEWQEELENALNSMDILVALITDNFHESSWTNQEVGFALGRKVEVISVMLGKEHPKGFINKNQAIQYSWDKSSQIKTFDLAQWIVSSLLRSKDPKVRDKMIDGYIQAMENCPNFNYADYLANILMYPPRQHQTPVHFSEDHIERMIVAIFKNNQLKTWTSFLKHERRGVHHEGLEGYLFRTTGKTYDINKRLEDMREQENKAREEHWKSMEEKWNNS